MWSVIWGWHPTSLTHEITQPDEGTAWRTYQDVSFNRYAALLHDDCVIKSNLMTGPVVPVGSESE